MNLKMSSSWVLVFLICRTIAITATSICERAKWGSVSKVLTYSSSNVWEMLHKWQLLLQSEIRSYTVKKVKYPLSQQLLTTVSDVGTSRYSSGMKDKTKNKIPAPKDCIFFYRWCLQANRQQSALAIKGVHNPQ